MWGPCVNDREREVVVDQGEYMRYGNIKPASGPDVVDLGQYMQIREYEAYNWT